ncbi:CinA family protein [Salmonella enterica subsp. enterica]|nr:CinA family protein [Salmonella enterica subsp. enterica]
MSCNGKKINDEIEQHDIVTLDEAESVDSLTKTCDLLVNQKLRLTTAESCTGGNWLALCAAEDTPSFYGGVGYVTLLMKPKQKIYAYNATALPNIPPRQRSGRYRNGSSAGRQAEVNISIAISGYGGPEGGEDGTPAGTACLPSNINNTTFYKAGQHFNGDCRGQLKMRTLRPR